MSFKELLQKLKKTVELGKEKGRGKEKKQCEQYPNRFLKFYHHNKDRLLKERKSLYHEKKLKGVCVRCNRQALAGIVFCEYHQQKQVGYNKQARTK